MTATDHSHLVRLHRKAAGFHKSVSDTHNEIAAHHEKMAGHSPGSVGEAAQQGMTAAATVSVTKGHYGDGVYGDDDPSGGLRKALH